MRSLVVLVVFGSLCVFVKAQCDVKDGKPDVPFPYIENEEYDAYQMAVEYTLPDAAHTDYYTEYYDMLNRRGRVEAHQAGKTSTYIYNPPTYESWDITGWTCTFRFLNETPEKIGVVQEDWLYVPDAPDKQNLITVGPSAMLKIAYDEWFRTIQTPNPKVFYMGEYKNEVRGIKAVYWRHCDGEQSYVDYVFTGNDYKNPYGLKDFNTLPLRILFGGTRNDRPPRFSTQNYDIIQFQPFISEGLRPFDLPRGKGCRRRKSSKEDDIPKPPNFSGSNLQLSAEVVYQTVDLNGDPKEAVTYYNTLRMALDTRSQMLAYHYSPWNETAPRNNPDVTSPKYSVFDMQYGYLYNYSLTEGRCELRRQKSFVPVFQLPRGRGGISLLDPQVLFPKNESVFLSEGVNRGLRVNVFEEVTDKYKLYSTDDAVPKTVITHTYLQADEVERNIKSIKNALTQVQLIFIGRLSESVFQPSNIMEIVTMNFYSFSTEIRNRRNTFNIKRCYKNKDDYVWITLSFNANETQLNQIQNDIPSIQTDVLNSITMGSDLNAARIPILEVDFSDALYVTMQVLGRPPVLLDFVLPPQNGKKITGSKEQEGLLDENTCATKCLEAGDSCWGFSMCGGVCTLGEDLSAEVEETKEYCKMYTHGGYGKPVPSTEDLVEDLQRQIQDGQLSLTLMGKDDSVIKLTASSIVVTDPWEDDNRFEKIGNVLNPRMQVVKVGSKLKSSAGSTIKNMGRLRYDECQRICLDYRDCETVSYCLRGNECILSKTYGGDLAPADMEENSMCNVISRKYADNFIRSPGNVLTVGAQEILPISNVEDCAKACLNRTVYDCLSFDHCPAEKKEACALHAVHYPNPYEREKVSKKSINCGHYIRKFSTEFKKNPGKKTVGSQLPPLTGLTLEDCAKYCVEYGNGTENGSCYGYDFCQGNTILATTCILLDSDPNKMQMAPSEICNNYFRNISETEEPTVIEVTLITKKQVPRPYTNGYAGGIGFLCFLIGGIVGAVIVFGIAYWRMNRR